MISNKGKIDIVNMVLEDCIEAYPISAFVISLYKQYMQRGSLSKKQLEGLYSKAAKIEGMSLSRLGTLEAIIKKMPTRYKSELPIENKPIFEKNEVAGKMIETILSKYPSHKRVLYLKTKFENNEVLTKADEDELTKFMKLLKLL
ncbi:MAG: hypothetical protein NVS3B19_16470 [Ginsengibacter sp.]